MKCEKCRINNATYSSEYFINGKYSKSNLCAKCAKIYEPDFKTTTVGKLFDAGDEVEFYLPITKKCTICGTKLSTLLKHGLVGCSNCYNVFKDELAGVISSAQDGNLVHLGKKKTKAEN